jgi:hypothetical protein
LVHYILSARKKNILAIIKGPHSNSTFPLGFDFQDGDRSRCNPLLWSCPGNSLLLPTYHLIFVTSNSQVQSKELPTESGETIEPMEQIAIPVMPDFKGEFEKSPEHKKCV